MDDNELIIEIRAYARRQAAAGKHGWGYVAGWSPATILEVCDACGDLQESLDAVARVCGASGEPDDGGYPEGWLAAAYRV